MIKVPPEFELPLAWHPLLVAQVVWMRVETFVAKVEVTPLQLIVVPISVPESELLEHENSIIKQVAIIKLNFIFIFFIKTNIKNVATSTKYLKFVEHVF